MPAAPTRYLGPAPIGAIDLAQGPPAAADPFYQQRSIGDALGRELPGSISRNGDPDEKTLIVYYSRSGFTRQVAQAIARLCDGDVDEIREARDRLGVWGFLRSCYEALAKRQPSIAATTADPANYGIVIIGTPIWTNHLASPVRSYIVSHRNGLRRVAFFCTSGRTPGDAVFAEMAKLCGREPVATVAITAQEILADRHMPRLDPLVKAATAP